MDAKVRHRRDRRGMKFPGYKTTPVETGWCVAAAISPVHGAPFCSRAIDRPAVAAVETPGMDAKVCLRRDRRGMKFPGYKTAPVETGWCVAAASKPRSRGAVL
jgi:hypothetical protein